ncbi:transcription factor subunit Med10 of mediator complex-domain-containing protein [Phlyctochytrium arcticum]|nr:transcription factor subunit Med10 of mediator complex-domain-containing protein [Phlyctochytrium arcticum]
MSLPPAVLPESSGSAADGTAVFAEKLQEYTDFLLRFGTEVHDYAGDDPDVVWNQLDAMTERLAELDVLKDNIPGDLQIPMAVLEHIDEGGNPDVFMKDWLQTLVDKNQDMKGKFDAYQDFESEIEDQLRNNFPEIDQLISTPPADSLSHSSSNDPISLDNKSGVNEAPDMPQSEDLLSDPQPSAQTAIDSSVG